MRILMLHDPYAPIKNGAVGGEDKKNSSSWILQEWKAPKTERVWGYYRVLHEVPGMKVKELTVNPGQSLSMQRHQHRAEYWIVSEGNCAVNSTMPNGYALPSKQLSMHDEFKIPVHDWHQLTNPYTTPCRIVEIQYGEQCIEEDIERK
jgi:mannose-6-phosphate isomerase-like protein (cupin superfamily)